MHERSKVNHLALACELHYELTFVFTLKDKAGKSKIHDSLFLSETITNRQRAIIAENRLLKSKPSSGEKAYERLQTEMDELKQQLKDVKKDRDALEARNQELAQHNTELAASEQEAQEEVDRLSNEFKHAKIHSDNVTKANDGLKVELQLKTKLLGDRRKELYDLQLLLDQKKKIIAKCSCQPQSTDTEQTDDPGMSTVDDASSSVEEQMSRLHQSDPIETPMEDDDPPQEVDEIVVDPNTADEFPEANSPEEQVKSLWDDDD